MNFKNWKTTLAGICALVPQLVSFFAGSIPAPLANLLTAIAACVAFYFAKDKDITGVN